MRRPRPPLFLAPDRYRRRRLVDAARMLPVLGAFLLMLPMLWRPAASGHDTAVEALYLFTVWSGLILAARLFAGPLTAEGGVPAAEPEDEPAEPAGDDRG